jgi:hypothetical protein
VELVGKKVLRVARDGEGVGLQFSEDWNLAAFERLTFENGCAIVVDLRAEPGSVAESMVLYGPDSTTVIWE